MQLGEFKSCLYVLILRNVDLRGRGVSEIAGIIATPTRT